MSSANHDPEILDPRVNSALQEFLERADRGEAVDHEQFLANHPEVADQLRSFIFDSDDLARRAATGSPPAAEVSTSQILSETIAPVSPGAAPLLPEVFGRYRLQRLLGRGAMGAVYLAQDTQLSRLVAIKVPSFSNGQSEELLQRFYLEARTAATLRNPHICPVYDVGEINGQHYISMAYIEGHSLSDVIRANGRQPEREVLLLVRKLALAMQEAHDQGVIHRDLKPGNVMIDPRGEPVLMDFGLAYQTREGVARITLSGVILGSPAYMSPEQLEGNSSKISPAADQYSLGVILYELLTGELPFRGSVSAVISQIVIKPAPSPLLLRPELDPRIDELCLQMLSKLPGGRLASMKAVADRIATILKGPAKGNVAEAGKLPVKVDKPDVAKSAVANRPSSQSVEIIKKPKETPAPPAVDTVVDSGKLQHLSTLCILAGKLIRKHDYAEAIRVLSSVPVESRTDELSDLLFDAEEKEEECNQLRKDIDLAIRSNQPKELPGLVRRFLQLKPANKAILTLASDLAKYGAEQVITTRRKQRDYFDPAGQVWNPWHISYFVVGLALFCVGVYFSTIAFQTPHGTVIIEVHDPRVSVNFANNEITATSSGKSFRLKVSEKKQLQLEVDGMTVDSSTQQISVERNETKLITARLVDGKLDLQINSEKKVFTVPASNAEKRGGQELANRLPATAPADWIDLIADVDPVAASGSITRWTREGNVLKGIVIPSAEVGWIPLSPSHELVGDYDLELDYLVLDCNYMQFALPLNETMVTVAVAATGTGLQWIDGKDGDWSGDRAQYANPNLPIRQGELHHFAASVRHRGDQVTVNTTIDGIVSGSFTGLRSRLSTPQVGSFKPGHRFRLVALFTDRSDNHRIEIHKARARAVTVPSIGTDNKPGWTNLFNGQDFTGWEGDTKFWSIKHNVLTSRPDMPDDADYLLTSKDYSDFELRLQFRLANQGNSGVQYRTTKRPPGKVPPVTGHQVDLGFVTGNGQPARFVTGDIWNEGESQIELGSLASARKELGDRLDQIYRTGEWNDLLVRCEGGRERVELNGVKTAEINDASAPKSGRIGFQLRKQTEIEFRNVQVRELVSSPPPSAPAPVTVAAPAREAQPANVILDIDFRKTHGGVLQSDAHHILSEYKNGEYRYLGKKSGWWFDAFHEVFWRTENNQLRDFAIEVDVRLIGRKKGLFAIEFGRSGDATLSLCLDQAGQVKLLHGNDAIVPPISSPSMKPVDQFNTLRLAVEDQTARVSMNGSQLFEKKLDRYGGAPISLWLGPDEVPFDVRFQRIHLERLGKAESRKLSPEVRRFKGHTDTVRGIAFLPDGQQAVSVGHNKAFKLWNVTTGQLIHDFVGHPDNVTSVALSSDGRRALTGCWDSHVRLWDVENRTLLKTLKGHTNHVGSVLLSPDGLIGMSSSTDGTIRQWDLKTGRSKLIPGPAPDCVLAMSPSGKVVAAGNADGSVLIRSSQGIASLVGHSAGFIEGLAFTSDGNKLVTGADDGSVRIWNLQEGKEIHRFEVPGVGFDSVAVSNDGRYVIAGSGDQVILGWNMETGDEVARLQAELPVMHRLALSPDNRYVLSGGGDRGWKSSGDFDLHLWKVPAPIGPPGPFADSEVTLLVDADFSKGLNGFANFEDDYFKAGLVNGEWQYAGKNSGWAGWGGDQPQIHGQHHDGFVFEAEMRWQRTKDKNSAWGLAFGFVPDRQDVRMHLSSDRTTWISRFSGGEWHDTLPGVSIPWMRAPEEFNTIRLEVSQGTAAIFMNSRYVGQCKLPNYEPGKATILLFPGDEQPDIRFKRIRFWKVNPSRS